VAVNATNAQSRLKFFQFRLIYAAVSTLQILCLVLAVLALVLALAFGVFRGRTPRMPAAVTPPSATSASNASAPPSALAPAVPATQVEAPEELNARFEALHRLQLLALSSQGVPAGDLAAHEEVASKVRWSLASVTDKPNYAPRRPLLLPKLVQAMNNDDVSRRELARIIGSDPGLAAGLFRLANSPFYRISTTPIESLDRAVAMLGIEGMRSLVAAALMQPVFKVDGGGFPRFGDITWQHTLASASVAESHAIMLESTDPFAAQLLALVMGLSSIVVFRVAIDEYQSRQLTPHPKVLMTLIDTQSAPVARQVAGSWQLSERVDAALADQSAPQGAKMSALGRSLQFGRFLGALSVLYQQQVLDDAAVSSALRTGGHLAPAYERIWAKRVALQGDGRR
jgi:HD-like signal output (HDOD) protein